MIRVLAVLVLVPGLVQAGLAHAGSITVRNGAGETISGIHMAPAASGSVGDNRLRSQLPPGAEARITYSTGCQADIRIAYASGRTETYAGVDACTDGRITAGQNGVAGPAMPANAAAASTPAAARSASQTAAAAQPAKIAQPPVPPWTGRSLTRRFGGME